jgi:pyruvate dehydrogenase E1 component beta subunit
MAMYYGSSLAAHHTDRPYPMLMNTPGLKVIAPASPYDAKGLLKAAIREDDPVVCFEDTNLWGTTAELPDDDFVVPLGSAEIKRAGDDVTVAAEDVTEDQISVEVVDPRTLVPMDWETILASVRKTGRLVVADPANRTCGAAAEIMATVAESCFGDLRAPMIRVTTPDIQIPFSPSMERGLFPNRVSIAAAVRRVCDIKGDDRGR